MIGDEKNVVVTAWLELRGNPLMFVLDAGDLTLSKVIEPANYYPNLNEDIREQLSSTLTNDHLFLSFAKDPDGHSCYFVIIAWDRKNNELLLQLNS